MSEVELFLRKARRSFRAADSLLESGDTDFAASRAYYGCFYVAEALLLDKGLSFATHAGVIGEYGRLFAKTGLLDRRFHRLLDRAFVARQSADYDAEFDLQDSEVREMIQRGREFLGVARQHLEHKGE